MLAAKGRSAARPSTICCILSEPYRKCLANSGQCGISPAIFRAPTPRPPAPHPRGCGGGDISPMKPQNSFSVSRADNAFAPHSFFTASLAEADPEIAAAIQGELGRQRHEIELIAWENIVSRAVLEAQGSVMTNKYAEGYPGARYYGGCEWVDVAQKPPIDPAQKLFGANFSHREPHSRRPKNQAGVLAPPPPPRH